MSEVQDCKTDRMSDLQAITDHINELHYCRAEITAISVVKVAAQASPLAMVAPFS
jgi:hypothetical protein